CGGLSAPLSTVADRAWRSEVSAQRRFIDISCHSVKGWNTRDKSLAQLQTHFLHGDLWRKTPLILLTSAERRSCLQTSTAQPARASAESSPRSALGSWHRAPAETLAAAARRHPP